MQVDSYVETFVELIRQAACQLPSDVITALDRGRRGEQDGSLARKALDTIIDNIDLAKQISAPICQDTGTPLVWIHHPRGESTRRLQEDFVAAVRAATAKQYLRPNAVDTLTGKNTGNGAGR